MKRGAFSIHSASLNGSFVEQGVANLRTECGPPTLVSMYVRCLPCAQTKIDEQLYNITTTIALAASSKNEDNMHIFRRK